MPKKFIDCVEKGGRVRTVKPTKGTHMPVCFPKGGGKGIAGEVRHKKKRGKD